MLTYDILIPAYNVQNQIRELLLQLESLSNQPGTIFVVDDGSTDKTPEIIQDFNLQVARLSKNQGKGVALKTGFNMFLNQSRSEYLLCMDADLQHPVSSVPDFLEHAEQFNSRFVIGKRSRKPGEMPFHRILSNAITSFIIGIITGQKIEDSQCGYRLMHRDLIDNVAHRLTEDGFQLESEAVLRAARAGFKVEFVGIPTIYSHEKSSIKNVLDTLKFMRFVLKNLVRRK